MEEREREELDEGKVVKSFGFKWRREILMANLNAFLNIFSPHFRIPNNLRIRSFRFYFCSIYFVVNCHKYRSDEHVTYTL